MGSFLSYIRVLHRVTVGANVSLLHFPRLHIIFARAEELWNYILRRDGIFAGREFISRINFTETTQRTGNELNLGERPSFTANILITSPPGPIPLGLSCSAIRTDRILTRVTSASKRTSLPRVEEAHEFAPGYMSVWRLKRFSAFVYGQLIRFLSSLTARPVNPVPWIAQRFTHCPRPPACTGCLCD